MKKKSSTFFILFLLIQACSSSSHLQASFVAELPTWYVNPKQNDGTKLYGVGEGHTLEEATKSGLVDAAARLIVSISSESSLLREENQNSANEEMRQKIKQNIEKIDFVNFSVAKSANFQHKIYVEIVIDREQFVSAQKEKVQFLTQKISNLQKNISSQNLIQKRNSLVQIVDLLKQSELLARILQAAGEEGNVGQKLTMLAESQNQLEKLNDNVEFFFDIKSSQEISAILRNALNKEKITVAKVQNGKPNQVVVSVKSSKQTGQVYGSYITKLKIDFQNESGEKIIASNAIEVSGSSTIGEKESYFSTLESLKEEIEKQGILKILGII